VSGEPSRRGPRAVWRAVTELARLPGIGPKSAQRLTYHLLRVPHDQVGELIESLQALRDTVVTCSVCFNVSDQDPCHICTDPQRDKSIICVVEEALDVLAIERWGRFPGLYHVLQGALSPMNGVGPDQLTINQLAKRLAGESVAEVILATNPNLEGDATALYLCRILEPNGVRITRLARGLPMGGDLEYADDVTIGNAFAGRQ
jgi:recombination protein RecR